MSKATQKLVHVALIVATTGGCSQPYKGVVRPTKAAALSPEMSSLTEASIEHHLKLNPQVTLPTVLAVAKLESNTSNWNNYGANYYSSNSASGTLAPIQGEEAERWRSLTKLKASLGSPIVEQVQFVSPLVCKANPTLKDLRDAAAMLHAPIMLVYSGADTHAEGVNSAAMAYWTIVGLFLVPGNTVGHFSADYAILVDTQTGGIIATAEGEAKKEENVLYGAVEIARTRTREQADVESLRHLHDNVTAALTALRSPVADATPEKN